MGPPILAFSTKTILDHVLVLHGLAAYAVVGALCFGEAAVLLGFVLPGETAVIVGGVLASQHKVSLPVMATVVLVAAISGDSVGFEVGRHFGPWLLRRRILARRAEPIQRGRRFLERHGGLAVFVGRFTALLRAMVPGLAGMSAMPYPRFLAANAAGGVTWGISYTLLGYFVGTAVESASGKASAILLGAIVIALGAVRLMNRYRERSARPGPVEATRDRL